MTYLALEETKEETGVELADADTLHEGAKCARFGKKHIFG